jgi:hypothetical protein
MEPGILKELGLDVERIERDRKACFAWASDYFETANKPEREERKQNQEGLMFVAAATNYRRAAAHSLLLGEIEKSSHDFYQAGYAYSCHNLPYGLMMKLFKPDEQRKGSEYISEWLDYIDKTEFPFPLKLELIYILLFSLIVNNSQNSRPALVNKREKLDSYRNYPIGVLDLSLGNHLDLYDVLLSFKVNQRFFQSNNQISLEEALLPFLNSYNNAIRLASQNSYQWKRLAFPFHPAEPDIFSILLLVELVIKPRERSIFKIIESIPLSWQSRQFLNGILSPLLKFNQLFQ